MKPIQSLIGMTVFLIDNSHQFCLTDKKCHYLAGTAWDEPIPVDIISEPFEYPVKNMFKPGYRYEDFILVKDPEGKLHMTMSCYKTFGEHLMEPKRDTDFEFKLNPTPKDFQNLLSKIQAKIAEDYDPREKKVGDYVIIHDGSANKDKNTGQERSGIDSLFRNEAMVIQDNCNEIFIGGTGHKYIMDLLVRFGDGTEVYCCSDHVKRTDNDPK